MDFFTIVDPISLEALPLTWVVGEILFSLIAVVTLGLAFAYGPPLLLRLLEGGPHSGPAKVKRSVADEKRRDVAPESARRPPVSSPSAGDQSVKKGVRVSAAGNHKADRPVHCAEAARPTFGKQFEQDATVPSSMQERLGCETAKQPHHAAKMQTETVPEAAENMSSSEKSETAAENQVVKDSSVPTDILDQCFDDCMHQHDLLEDALMDTILHQIRETAAPTAGAGQPTAKSTSSTNATGKATKSVPTSEREVARRMMSALGKKDSKDMVATQPPHVMQGTQSRREKLAEITPHSSVPELEPATDTERDAVLDSIFDELQAEEDTLEEALLDTVIATIERE